MTSPANEHNLPTKAICKNLRCNVGRERRDRCNITFYTCRCCNISSRCENVPRMLAPHNSQNRSTSKPISQNNRRKRKVVESYCHSVSLIRMAGMETQICPSRSFDDVLPTVEAVVKLEIKILFFTLLPRKQ